MLKKEEKVVILEPTNHFRYKKQKMVGKATPLLMQQWWGDEGGKKNGEWRSINIVDVGAPDDVFFKNTETII